MNILILISSLNYGGAEKQAVTDANILAQDNTVWLISFMGGPLKYQLTEKVEYLQIKKNGYIRTALNLRKIVFDNQISVIYASLFSAMIISLIATIKSHVNIFWHFHSHEFDSPISSKIAYMIFSWAKQLKMITFVNSELKNYLSKKLLLPAKKLILLYNSSAIECTEKRPIMPKSIFVIGFVGRLIPLKRVHYLLLLAEKLLIKKYDNFEVWIVGDGGQYLALASEIKDKSLSEHVKLWGFHDDLKPFYSQFNLFILPSNEECLSIALIDAGRCGIPAIAFDTGGNNEIILNGKTGFIVRSFSEMVEYAELLMKDNELLLKLSIAAREYCANQFSQETRKRKLLELAQNDY